VSFDWPRLLWLLLLLPVAVSTYVWLLRRRARGALVYPSLGVVRAALGPGTRIRRHVPPAILLLALAAMMVAAARPNAVVPLMSNQKTVILAVDVSLSMRADDVQPNRISAAQTAVKSFLEEMPPLVRVGIVAFAGTASVVQPPTQRREDLTAAVDRLTLQRHTATGSALLVSLAALLPDAGIDVEQHAFGKGWPVQKTAPAGQGAKAAAKPAAKPFTPVPPGSYQSGVIVLMSDGRRTVGPDPVEAARIAAERGVKVYTVGFGTAAGGQVDFGGYSMYMRLDEEALKQVADITRAEYFNASNALELKKVYQDLTSKLVLETKETEITALFAGLGALFALLAAMLSLRWFQRSN
jgi:Ca-activated chloride channel family protein